jgi:hypothetical protein
LNKEKERSKKFIRNESIKIASIRQESKAGKLLIIYKNKK